MKLQWKHLSVKLDQGHYIFKGQYTLAIPVDSMSLDKACKLAESVIKRVKVKAVTKAVTQRVNPILTVVEELAFNKLVTVPGNIIGDSHASH